MSLDIGPAIRTTLIGGHDDLPPQLADLVELIVGRLGEWHEAPSVFAFRPAPEDAGDPIIIINPDASIGDQDGLTSNRPVVQRDIAIYGRKGTPGDPSDDSPKVEQLGFLIRELFHRQRFSVRPEGYSVTDIVASGPVPAPVDDDGEVGRLVSLTIRLRRKP